jgi:hypothetical protein
VATVDDLDQVIEQLQRALNDFLKGNAQPGALNARLGMVGHRRDRRRVSARSVGNPYLPRTPANGDGRGR